MKKACLLTDKKGTSLVEAILAGAVFSLLVAGIVSAIVYGEESTDLAGKRARAAYLAEEGIEAARNLRDESFANLVDGAHGLSTAGSEWSFSGASDVTDIFTRAVTVATVDATTKAITSTVSWQQTEDRTGGVTAVSRLTNWIVTKVVAAGWSLVSQESALDLSGNENGLKVQVQGNYAYVVRGGGTPEFGVFDISNPAAPSLVGSLALNGTPSNIAVSGNYAYVSSDDNSSELQVVNITTPATPTLAGSYNAVGNANASGVYIAGTTVYLVRVSSSDNEFIVVNVTTPATPTLVGSLNLGADAGEVYASGNYAYVASADNAQELQVVNITTPASPTLAGSLDITGSSNALTITGFGTSVILGRVGGDVSFVDVTTPGTPTLITTLNLADNINDIALGLSDTHLFVATDLNATELQILDITTLSSPVVLGSLDVLDDLNGIAYDGTLDRAIAVGDDNAEEFVVFMPN